MKPTGYSVTDYGDMITCEPRMSANAEALRRAVTPGCTVIDIGAGPGIFSLLACQYGAGSVIAIEPDTSVELLRQLAADNGYCDRITIVQGLSTAYSPTTKADVIISDIRGALPFFENHISTIVDARERLLAPMGKLIPWRDTIYIALVHSPETYAPCEEPWLRNKFGIDLSHVNRLVTNDWSKVKLKPAALYSEPTHLALLNYQEISSSDLANQVELNVKQAGTAHGLLLWFDTELAPGIGFSNAPGEPEQIYGQTFFPFEWPVEVAPGDRIEVEIKANLIDNSYVWSWNSKVWRKSTKRVEKAFRQSSFLARVLSSRKLARWSNSYVPPAQPAHAIDKFCLSLFDSRNSLGDIAEQLLAEFPKEFGNNVQALNHIVALAERYKVPSGRVWQPLPPRPSGRGAASMIDILERQLSPSQDAVESAVGDETVILHLRNGTYYGLDPVGTRIWALLKEGLAPVHICERLAFEYDTPREIIEEDARKFLIDLAAQDIVVDA